MNRTDPRPCRQPLPISTSAGARCVRLSSMAMAAGVMFASGMLEAAPPASSGLPTALDEGVIRGLVQPLYQAPPAASAPAPGSTPMPAAVVGDTAAVTAGRAAGEQAGGAPQATAVAGVAAGYAGKPAAIDAAAIRRLAQPSFKVQAQPAAGGDSAPAPQPSAPPVTAPVAAAPAASPSIGQVAAPSVSAPTAVSPSTQRQAAPVPAALDPAVIRNLTLLGSPQQPGNAAEPAPPEAASEAGPAASPAGAPTTAPPSPPDSVSVPAAPSADSPLPQAEVERMLDVFAPEGRR